MYSIAPFASVASVKATQACHDVGPAQTPISGILAPGHEGRIGRLLDEEVGGPAQEIRTVEILNRVEDSAMADEFRQPGEK